MAAILHPIQSAIRPNDEPERIVESRMPGEVAVGGQSLDTCSGQRGDSAWRCRWLKKRCGYRCARKLHKLPASRLSFHRHILLFSYCHLGDGLARAHSIREHRFLQTSITGTLNAWLYTVHVK